jgi:hypothetical protein
MYIIFFLLYSGFFIFFIKHLNLNIHFSKHSSGLFQNLTFKLILKANYTHSPYFFTTYLIIYLYYWRYLVLENPQ